VVALVVVLHQHFPVRGDVVDFWDVVNRQDWGICESVQAGMRSRGFRGAYYAPMEDPSMDIRRYLETHLGDLNAIP
jgi:glycine betaine catabolism A